MKSKLLKGGSYDRGMAVHQGLAARDNGKSCWFLGSDAFKRLQTNLFGSGKIRITPGAGKITCWHPNEESAPTRMLTLALESPKNIID
jgi:hypothetical protein